MITEESTQNDNNEYKNFEMELRRELMTSCRRYIKKLSIFSILGILDFVKQETVELEKATSQNINNEQTISLE
jgi:hypothetical protein